MPGSPRIVVIAVIFLFSAVVHLPAQDRSWKDPTPVRSPRAGVMERETSDVQPTGKMEEMIVFTANQNWLSRIYLLRKDGTVFRYFEYDFYRWCGLEVVNNTLYVAEAYAPRIYCVDPLTGAVDVFIDDWSLYYIYDLCFDGNYFYLDEWNLRRYDGTGHFDSAVSLDEMVYGMAFDGAHLWILNDEGWMHGYDITAWPAVQEIPGAAFRPPGRNCRGLWFDGQYFWTAEGISDALGKIYQFNHEGGIVREWTAPAFVGWGACLIEVPVP